MIEKAPDLRPDIRDPVLRDLRDIGRVLTAIIAKDGSVTIPDFGTLTARLRSASFGRTPAGKRVPIPAQPAVDFAPARALKAALAETVRGKAPARDAQDPRSNKPGSFKKETPRG